MTDESVQMDIMEHKERRSITQAPGETYITNLDAVSVADPSHVPDEIKAMLKNMDADPFSEDETELRFLLSKPTCFIILGKPGVGKTALARRLAQEWKCVLINSTDILLENMELHTEMGQRCAEMLTRGEAVPENIVIQLIKEKIDSPEVAHHGYVLDDFPCMSEATLTIHDQLELVKSWKLKPDFIINIRLPDKDLERRLLGQKVDPVTGDIYTREVYAPEKPVKPITKKEGEEEEEEEEEHAEEEEMEEEEHLAELPVEILERLIRRPEDMQQQVEKEITYFKENMLRLIEDYMADHNQQYLVELDGNQPLDILLKQVIQKMNCFVVRPAAAPILLQGEEEEETPEDIDTDELMRSLASRKMLAPRFRWRRSRWLRYCPVALFEGSKVLGKPDHAVSFLDKMYCFSSPEAMEKFMRNPRPYLLPPQPRPPCKIVVLGPPVSGKSSICALLAQKYNAKVLKVEEIIKPSLKEEKEKLLHKVKTETTEAAIQAIKTKIKEQLEAEMQAKEEAARLAAEIAAKEAEERAAVEAKEKEEQEERSKTEVKDNMETDKFEEEEPVPPPEPTEPVPPPEPTEPVPPPEPTEPVPPPEPTEPVPPPEPTEPVPPPEPTEPVPPSEPEEPVPPPEPEVDATHPEVVSMVTAAVAEAEKQEITLPAEVIVEIMEAAIADAEHKMANEQPSGPLKGGWILDNFPSTREQWNVCIEKNLLPDDVIVLNDTSENGTFLTTRYYTVNRDYIVGKARERLMLAEMEKQRIAEEKRRQEEEERRIAEELRKAEEEAKRAEEEAKQAEEAGQEANDGQLNEEKSPAEKGPAEEGPAEKDPAEKDQEVEDESAKVKENIEEKAVEKIEEVEIKTDVAPKEKIPGESLEMEGAIDVLVDQDTDEIKIPEGPEMELYYKQRQEYDKELETVNGIISGGTSLEPLVINISSRSLEEILEEITQGIESDLIYRGGVYSSADQEEEEMEATGEEEEEEEAESEAEDTEEVNPSRNPKKPLGESSFFCPVTLKETNVLFPGDPENAVRYREKLYYFSSSDTRDQFLQNPLSYISKDKPLQPPPLRLVILGPRGSGKTLHGRHLAEKLGLFHIAFTERLQELIIAKTKKKIGPKYEEGEKEAEEEEEVESGDEEDVKEKTEDDGEDENKSVKLSPDAVEGATDATAEEAEVELTEMEEAIKSSLEANESLAPEFLETIVPQWWHKEPFKSTGFILEEFPRSPEEARFLSENGLFPDAAIILRVSDGDVIGRLLPPKMDKWRAKRDKMLEKKKRKKDKAKKKRDAAIQKRREELLKEREERQAERAAEKAANREGDSDNEDEDEAANEEGEEDEEEEDIEAILAEEFEPEAEEEEEEEELEPDAMERMRNELTEAYEDQNSKVESVQETLTELLIPKLIIEAGRKNHIVRYILNKKLKPYVEFRQSLFERVYPISEQLAQQMIRTGYKQPSCFGRWCPVKLHEGDCIQPMNGPGYASYPCIYRQHIYYLSSKSARDTFVANPLTYLKQPSPKPVVPIRIAIIGPPKSGKTTLSNRFVEEYGVVRLSIGESMRRVLQTQPKSELAQLMNQCLYQGKVVPDELQVQSLEVCLLDMNCQTRGYVLDGYPITKKQVDLMNQRSIIPVRVIELEMNSNEVMVRGTKDRLSPARTFPMHDSAQILQTKLMSFKNAEQEVHDWYENEHMNIMKIDALQSKWMIWNRALEIVQAAVIQIQTYLQRIDQGKAASIADMCIRPTEFEQRVGDFGQYCPVSLALYGELIDCATKRELTYAAEFRGHYYKMKGKKELDQFLADAEAYVPPRAPQKLPPPELLPKRRRPEEVKSLRETELQGYCPVTFLDGKCMYEAIVPGDPDLIVEYKDKVYYLESEEKLLKFMSLPEKYWNLKLPHKLPPHKKPMPLTGLPMLGYMEQGVATALIAALTAAGNFKPKYPFISSTRSALLYVAYHLKAFNPKSSDYIRKKYKQKLRQFEETCNLIRYLGNNMTVRYRDPSERPADFDSKMEVFFALKGTEPTPTWIA